MKKILVLILITVIVGGSLDVYADDKKTTETTTETSTEATTETKKSSGLNGNDGEVVKGTIFGDSGIASSYENCKYYDIWIPYKKTVADVGGLADDVDTAVDTYRYTAFTYGYDKHRMGGFLQTEFSDHPCYNYGLTWKTDSKNGLMYCEVNGAKIYASTLGKGCFNYSAVTDGTFFSWAGATGILFDIILTDGTVLHFVMDDGIGEAHSNQDGPYDGWTAPSQAEAQDNTRYHTTKLANKEYGFFMQCASTHMLEIIGSSSKAMEYYNIGETDDTNQVMYIRIYNLKIGTEDARKDVKPVKGKEKDWNTEVSKDSKDGSGSTDTGSNPENQAVGAGFAEGYYSEMQLGQFQTLYDPVVAIEASRDDFTSKELSALSDWEQNVQKMNEKGSVLYWVRMITMILGILFTVWMLLIYIAYWFDRLNNIIDIDLLPLLTFHRLRLSDTEENCTFRASDLAKTETRTVNHRAILSICIVGIVFGALVISGYLYVAILTLVQKVFEVLGIGG